MNLTNLTITNSTILQLTLFTPQLKSLNLISGLEIFQFGGVIGINNERFGLISAPDLTPSENTLNYINTKYYVQNIASKVEYKGVGRIQKLINTNTSTATITTKSGSTDVTQPATITLNTPGEEEVVDVQGTFTSTSKSRLEVAGVDDVSYQFFNNNSEILNDNNIIEYIRYVFEEKGSINPKGKFTIKQYELPNGEVIQANLPAETKLVAPVTDRVTNVDDYLRDVIRDRQTQ